MNYFRRLLLVLVLIGQAFSVMAFDLQTLPEVLKAWVPWVLHDQPRISCPFFNRDFQQKRCSWSGLMKLDLQDRHGDFSSEWTLYQPDWILLPGDEKLWPQRVIINQKPAVVIEHQSKPAVWMSAGRYQISGEFFWDKLPDNLVMAEDIGLIQLTINDKPIQYPRIEQGALWLKPMQSTESEPQGNGLDVQVFRQVIDDNPLQVVTRLELNVSGKAREVILPHALLSGFIPVRLDSPLPARIESDGGLQVQVRSGRWTISLHARHPQALTQLGLSIKDPAWPEAEVWVFQAMPALRLVEVEKLSSIDASQTNLPPEWRHLPAYQVKQGQSMVFKVIRQGDPEPEPNKLRLQRKLWLDFEGGGYSVSDQINGKMTLDWRLNALPELELGQVLMNGQNQLITQIGEQQRGIEVRRGLIQLQADSRIQSGIDRLNAVGWQQAFQQVQAELNIPPGWRLLAVSGVDNDPNSWLTRWTLLDLFLLLMVALAVSRLWSWHWGLIALFSLMLFWHEAGAPQWIWLNTLAALALLRVLPDSRFARGVKWYRNLCWLSLVLILIPFMIEQIRIGIYPQLERPWQPIEPVPYVAGGVSSEDMAATASMDQLAAPAVAPMAKRSRKIVSAIAQYHDSAVNFDRIDPEANLQTGPGLPQWQWQTVQLSWNGAVDSQQEIRLWYLPPAWNLVLHVMQALLAALMALKLMGVLNKPWRLALPTLGTWFLLLFLIVPSADSLADIPDQSMLEQLKARLLEAPVCLPDCAEIASMKLTSKPDEMWIELQVHAQQDLAIPLPAQSEQWLPEQVVVDGVAANLVRRGESLWVVLNRGVHKVQLSGRHARKFKFSLPLALTPKQSELNLEGWRVEGWYENGKTAEQLEFSRINSDSQDAETRFQQGVLPAFVRVERTLHLGLDWRVTTRVVRLAGNDNPVVLQVPLLPGEAVISERIRVENGKVLVNMPAGQNGLDWESLLEKRQQLELIASDTHEWSELWRADVSPIWHLQISGIAVVHHQDQQGAWLPEWRPWPGESVHLSISRPKPVPGATLTIDKSQLSIQPGKRSQIADLTLNMRSSKGGQHTLVLPPEAMLQSVSIDGVMQPIRQKADTVTLPIHPGTQQVALNWQSISEQAMVLRTPSVNLGINSVNSHIRVVSGKDRWVLFTFGPKFGPAALIWGLLIVLLLLGLALGRITLTPLKSWQWFLLLIGLSQIHLAAAMLVVIWLLALGVRARHSPESVRRFNLAQLGLGLLTLVSILLLFAAVQQGLLGTPDMQITGNQSTASNLNWYQDHGDAQLPRAIVVSVPMLFYRLLMLCWALWMALSLMGWLRWGWDCFASGGVWKKKLAQKG